MIVRLRPGPALIAGILWGSIWGLYEATVGFLIHSVPRVPGAASVLVVPFALFCLFRAARIGGARAPAIAAATAAAIKLMDLMLPAPTFVAVINPAVAILLEGLTYLVVTRALLWPVEKRALPVLAAGALSFNLLWRALFLLHQAGVEGMGVAGFLRNGGRVPLDFLVRDAVLSAAVISLVLGVTRPATGAVAIRRPSTRLAFGMFALAIAAELAGRLV